MADDDIQDLDEKKKALQKLKDNGMLDKEDDPEGLLDTPAEHFQRMLDKKKKDDEDALNYKG